MHGNERRWTKWVPRTLTVASTMKSIATAPQDVKGFTGTTAQEIYERCSLEKEISTAPTVDESPADYAVRLMKSCDENEWMAWKLVEDRKGGPSTSGGIPVRVASRLFAGAARLFARSTQRLQTGVHWAGRVALRHAAGI